MNPVIRWPPPEPASPWERLADAMADVLQKTIQKMLADARVCEQSLPLCPGLPLWLVDPLPMQRAFSAEEIRRIETYPAYWAFCWASGQVMAAHILDQPDIVAGKTVLDFGAGSGVVAIAAAKAGAARVIACDNDPDALLACRENARLNGVSLELSDDFFASEERIDLLLAADVLYDRANLPLLSAFTERAQEVLVADSRIRDFNVPPYRRTHQLDAHTVPDLDEAREFRQVSLYAAKGPS